jgi:HlyD family secretion protein
MANSKDIEETLGVGTAREKSIRRKTIYGLITLLIVVLAGLWWWMSREGTPDYITEEVRRGALTVVVSATGELEAVNTVEVGSEISGLIETVYVDYNDEVTEGQVLAKMDTERLEAEVTQARASLEASEAALMQAQAVYEEEQNKMSRAERLAEKDLISTQELETQQAALKRAEAEMFNARSQIEVNKAALQMAETSLRKASIRSPIDGVVLTSDIKPGQAVAASFQTPVLFTLAEDLTNMELNAEVDEADIGQVKKGQRATFTVDAYTDTVFPAEINKVYYAPITQEDVTTYQAILSVDNTGLLLLPGMTATTDIITEKVDDALLVPNSALRFTPPGESRPQGEQVVWILEREEPKAVVIKGGITDGRYTRVLSDNLQEGQEVLINIRQEE